MSDTCHDTGCLCYRNFRGAHLRFHSPRCRAQTASDIARNEQPLNHTPTPPQEMKEVVHCRQCLDTGIAPMGRDEGEDFCEACPVGREKSAAAECDELCALNGRLGELLKGVAYALKGDPGPLTMHDWSDLPKVAAAVVAERDYVGGYLADIVAIRKVLDDVNAPHDPEDGASLEPTRIRLLADELREALEGLRGLRGVQ